MVRVQGDDDAVGTIGCHQPIIDNAEAVRIPWPRSR
jgi:hypothetical protein